MTHGIITRAPRFPSRRETGLRYKGKEADHDHKRPIGDVIGYGYTGNRLHPTQKPVEALHPLIECFNQAGDLVFDPFLGSGSTLVAAAQLGREWLGIELDATHHRTARERLR